MKLNLLYEIFLNKHIRRKGENHVDKYHIEYLNNHAESGADDIPLYPFRRISSDHKYSTYIYFKHFNYLLNVSTLNLVLYTYLHLSCIKLLMTSRSTLSHHCFRSVYNNSSDARFKRKGKVSIIESFVVAILLLQPLVEKSLFRKRDMLQHRNYQIYYRIQIFKL